MYDTSALMLVLIRWQKQLVPGQAQAMDETNQDDIQFKSGGEILIGNVNMINSLQATPGTNLHYMPKI